MSFEPPPRRTPKPSTPSTPSAGEDGNQTPGWKEKMKAKGSVWGKIAVEKGVKLSDNIGGKVNNIAEQRFGTEAFWPVTGDFPKEMEKCARILRAFTVDGIVTEEKEKADPNQPDEPKKKKKIKVIRKIPPSVIASAKGLAIFTSMRTGFAPFGGAGGNGLVVAKLPGGTWSAPASITPNNLSAGFLIGVDVYDCVLVIRTQEALDSFRTHKVTIGAELAVAAGPYGAGAAVEAGRERAPLFSYVKSKGVYAGVEVVGQVFVERFDENGAMYHWPGVKAGDILSGKVKVPREAESLMAALKDAESGRAQTLKGDSLDMIVAVKAQQEETEHLDLHEGETLKLPPTPDQTDGHEHESDPETEKIHYPSQLGSHNPSPTSSSFNLNNISKSDYPTQTPLPPPQHPSILQPKPIHGQSGKCARLLPPALPSRNPRRPNLNQQNSSQSNYSDALETPSHLDNSIRYDAPAGPPPPHLLPSAGIDQDHRAPSDPPHPPTSNTIVLDHGNDVPPPAEELPAYAENYASAISSPSVATTTYPQEKNSIQNESLVPLDALGADGQPMSESERKEWEEFLKSDSGITADIGPSSSTIQPSNANHEVNVDGLSGKLEDSHLYQNEGKGKEREEEPLKNPFDK
ncbi:uncharacterized protein L201_000323 [Kwoniella dendrophila CBS 6074]|uniref:Ysc84 actin-binding domain-containing protein n=1 Tax=Kwoniella dendrophila CBS 6074 TaxID=1295534 RepID=A0AAX4JLM9_9TREE